MTNTNTNANTNTNPNTNLNINNNKIATTPRKEILSKNGKCLLPSAKFVLFVGLSVV
jgi:hypothetical protein